MKIPHGHSNGDDEDDAEKEREAKKRLEATVAPLWSEKSQFANNQAS